MSSDDEPEVDFDDSDEHDAPKRSTRPATKKRVAKPDRKRASPPKKQARAAAPTPSTSAAPAAQAKKPSAPSKSQDAGGGGGAASDASLSADDSDYDSDDLLNMRVPERIEPTLRADGTGERLMIDKIVVTNFKSYYGTQTIGPFHHKMTCVIGPNGSGKSNVIDALLFVFGFRGNKIRSKKLSLLIHASAKHDDIPFCHVDVHMHKVVDNPDGTYEILDGKSFVVGRRAHRDNTSVYYINGRRSKPDEVVDRLQREAVDLKHNRFLILQGEVEQIAMMKPIGQNKGESGMLEYLEDIIGSSRFKTPIERIDKKVGQLMEQKKEQGQTLSRVENEVKALRGPVQKMVEFMQTENAIAETKNKLAQIDKQKLIATTNELEEARASAHESVNEIKQQMRDLTEQQKDRDEESKRLHKAVEEAESALAEAKQKKGDAEQRETKRKADLKRNEDALKKLKDDKKKEEKKLKDLEEVPERAASKVDELKKRIEELRETKESAEKLITEGLSRVEQRTVEPAARKKVLEEKLAPLVAAEDKFSSELSLAQQQKALLNSDVERAEKLAREIGEKLETQKTNAATKKRDLEAARSGIPDLKKRQAEAREEGAKASEASKKLNADRDKLADKIHSLKSLADEHRMNNVLTSIMKLKEAPHNLKDIYGRMGDLAGIDDKYDAAISSNCGQLDFVLVESVDTAAKCIEHLRSNNLGRMTFLALEKIADPPSMDKKRQYPEDVPRLFDLLTIPNPAHRKAFYSALTETLVAQDIHQAKRVAFGGKERFCVATLQGQLVDVKGTMTGGGEPIRGKIGRAAKRDTAEARQKLAAAEQELADLDAKLAELQRERSNCDESIVRISSDITTLEQRERRLSYELEGIEKTCGVLTEQAAKAARDAESKKVDQKTLDEAQRKIDELQRKTDEAADEAAAVQKQVSRVDAEIREIRREELGSVEDDRKLAIEQLEAAETALTKEQTAINQSGRNIAKCRQRLDDFNKDIEEREAAVERLEAEEVEGKAAAKLDVEIAECKERVKDADRAVREHRNKGTDFAEREAALTKQLRQVEEKKNEVEDELRAIVEKIRAIDKQIAQLRLHDTSDFQSLELDEDFLKPSRKNQFFDATLNESSISSVEPENEDDDGGSPRSHHDQHGGDKEQPTTSANGLPVFTAEQCAAFDKEDLKKELMLVEKKRDAHQGSINMRLVAEYRAKLDDLNAERAKLDAIEKRRIEHSERAEELRKQRVNEFMEGFVKIGVALKEMYQMITLGGDASLDLRDQLYPFLEGVNFMVRPPKKSWKQISNLSGGEKTLSSLALVFALHHYRPTPLYVMDEIDAALDFRNVSIIAHYIKDRTANAQFVIISLRNNMFELADRLVGIYKTHDCTHNVVVDPAKVLARGNAHQRVLGSATTAAAAATGQRMTTERQRAEAAVSASKA